MWSARWPNTCCYWNHGLPTSVERPYVPGWFEAMLVRMCHSAWFSAIDKVVTSVSEKLVVHAFEDEGHVRDHLMESELSTLRWCGELWMAYICVVVIVLWSLYTVEVLVHVCTPWVIEYGMYVPIVSFLVTLNLWAYLGVVGWVLVWTWWVDRKGTCAERMGL